MKRSGATRPSRGGDKKSSHKRFGKGHGKSGKGDTKFGKGGWKKGKKSTKSKQDQKEVKNAERTPEEEKEAQRKRRAKAKEKRKRKERKKPRDFDAADEINFVPKKARQIMQMQRREQNRGRNIEERKERDAAQEAMEKAFREEIHKKKEIKRRALEGTLGPAPVGAERDDEEGKAEVLERKPKKVELLKPWIPLVEKLSGRNQQLADLGLEKPKLVVKKRLQPLKKRKSEGGGVMTSVHPHPLYPFNSKGGWACDGRRLDGGCRQGCTDYGQCEGWERFRCVPCDYDLCGVCTRHYQIAADAESDEETVGALAGFDDEVVQEPPKLQFTPKYSDQSLFPDKLTWKACEKAVVKPKVHDKTQESFEKLRLDVIERYRQYKGKIGNLHTAGTKSLPAPTAKRRRL